MIHVGKSTAGLLLLLALGCTQQPWESTAEARESGIVPTQFPDLAGRSSETVRALEGLRTELERGLAGQAATPADRAAAYGEAGRRYQAHGLQHVARAAYDNAGRLAPQEFRWAYLLGRQQELAGDLEPALESYRRAAELRPGDLAAQIRLGNVCLTLGRNDEARAAFEATLELDEQFAAAHYGLGRLASREDRPDEALRRFTAALEIQPGATSLHYPLAMALRELGREDEARRHLEQVGRVKVSIPDALTAGISALVRTTDAEIFEGNRLLAAGDHAGATELYRLAVESDPERAEARTSLGSALYLLGDFDGTLEQYREAARLAPNDARVQFNLGEILRRLGDLTAAATHYDRAGRLDPSNTDAFLGLAAVNERTGRLDLAVTNYGKVLEIDPGNRTALLGLPGALAGTGRLPEAVERLRSLLAVRAADAGARVALGSLLVRSGDPEAGLLELGEAVRLGGEPPAIAAAHLQIGILLGSRGLADRAAGHYESAVTLDPELVGARINWANHLNRRGRHAEASQHYTAVLAREPRNASARLGGALAALLSGDQRRALAILEEGLRPEPEHIGLNHALGRLLATASDASLRDGERALRLATIAFQGAATLPHAETVAMALAEAGKLDQAVEWQARLVAQAEKTGAPELPRLREALARYRNGDAIRAPWNPSR